MVYYPCLQEPLVGANRGAISSVGQSYRLITGWSWVRVPDGPPAASAATHTPGHAVRSIFRETGQGTAMMICRYSSAGQSDRLLSGRSEVQILLATPNAKGKGSHARLSLFCFCARILTQSGEYGRMYDIVNRKVVVQLRKPEIFDER